MFAGLIFAYLLPQQVRLIIERKKEMLRELTAPEVIVLAEQDRDVQAGTIPLHEAQRMAIARLRDMRSIAFGLKRASAQNKTSMSPSNRYRERYLNQLVVT